MIRLLSLMVLCFSFGAWSNVEEPEKIYPKIYPHAPMDKEYIFSEVEKMLESRAYLGNIKEMVKPELFDKKSKVEPWSSFWWQTANGFIADDYRKSFLNLYIFTSKRHWPRRLKRFARRKKRLLSRVYDLPQKKLDDLAPSEKYDLALGDTSYDLTHRLWNYTKIYGKKEEQAFITKIELPENYVLEKVDKKIRLWEGICHGWATAATTMPRPRKTVELDLPNGRKLRFFPEDIKALLSLSFANSFAQDAQVPLLDKDGKPMTDGSLWGGTLMTGVRCERRWPKKDKWGRFYNPLPITEFTKTDSCIGIHPAIWHLSMVNIIGKYGESFITDIDTNNVVNNHPVFGYKLKYFNPRTGRYGQNLKQVMMPVKNYRNDPFKAFRHKETYAIVGVDMTMLYKKWVFPQNGKTNSEKDDGTPGERTFFYDLEVDKDGKIIGGQWRRTLSGARRTDDENEESRGVKWPDFAWKMGRNAKIYLEDRYGLEPWYDKTGLPPASWKERAFANHKTTYLFGYMNTKCRIVPTGKKGPVKKINCEKVQPRPQPLQNFVNGLLELSK